MFFKLMIFGFLSTVIKTQNFREILKSLSYVFRKQLPKCVDNLYKLIRYDICTGLIFLMMF